MSLVLPITETEAMMVNPSQMIIYSQPKMGKTTLLSKLKGCLILDLEKGTKYVKSLNVQVTSLDDPGDDTSLENVIREIYKAGYDKVTKTYTPTYEYIALDTITKLEEWCEAYATKMYMETPQGKNFKGKSVLELPQGAGYFWLREALKLWVNRLKLVSKHLIIVAHLKEKMIDKNGTEVTTKDIELVGKNRTNMCADSDAIGLLYRENGKMKLCFKTSDEVTCGSRCDHLKGKIVDMEDSKGNVTWDNVFV